MSCTVTVKEKEIVKKVKVIDGVILELTLPEAILVMNLLANTGSSHANQLFYDMEKAGVPDVEVVKNAEVKDDMVTINIDHNKLEEAISE
jgi:hypothetical protein